MKFLQSCAVTLAASFAILLMVSCGTSAPIGEKVGLKHTDGIRKGLVNAERIMVYEGLPHQAKEKELLQQELAKGNIERILAYPFYLPAQKALHPSELKELLGDASNYREYTGPKTCGGFHPDYALSWQNGGTRHDLLVCYGCSEVLMGDGVRTWAYDLKHDALAKLQSLLEPHARLRPR